MGSKEKKVIVITGASGGFGSLTARTLSRDGHIVCMRETDGRNASRVKEVNDLCVEINAAVPIVAAAILYKRIEPMIPLLEPIDKRTGNRFY